MKIKAFVTLFLAICCSNISQAKAWDITEEMMQEMISTSPGLEKSILKELPCASKVNVYRQNKEKSLTIELILKEHCCSGNLYFPDKKMIDKIKSLSQFSGLVHWFQRGFYFRYIYKSPDGKKLHELIIDREKLFWKPFSLLREPVENFDNILIAIGKQNLTFQAKGFEISGLLTPAHPIIQMYCNINFHQEQYYFVKGNIYFLISVISLLPSQSDSKQLQCIRDSDLRLLKKTKQKYQVKTVSNTKSLLLKPTYKIIGAENNKETINLAFSNLIAPHIALYVAFSAPYNAQTQQEIDNIITSFKLETK